MMRLISIFSAALLALSAQAAERAFDFGETPVDQTPTNFHALVAGRGRPADWKILLDDVPPVLAPLTSKAESVTKRPVLAQVTREPFSVRFPLFIFDGDTYRDFKFTARFKLAGGALAEAAGLVFRFENESNFFIVLANGTEGTFQCTRVIDGKMQPPLPLNPPQIQIGKGQWHNISIQCEGTRITGSLDGGDQIKLVDNSAAKIIGKIGFCTRADAVTYFADARVTFTSSEIFAQKLVQSALAEYSRLVNLKIYAARPGEKEPAVVASKNEKELGQPGAKAERDVIKSGHSYYGKGKETVTVILPLRDRNGDPMAAVALEMKTFTGQTEDNALTRAQPIIRKLQAQVQSIDDLLE